MPKTKSPVVALLAAVLMVSLWLPTLAMPQAQATTLMVPALA